MTDFTQTPDRFTGSLARYTRQSRLAEVGELGQERLHRSEATVRTRGLTAEVEARYLAGAGVGTIRCGDPAAAASARASNSSVSVEQVATAPEQPERISLPLDDETADAFLEGAVRALAFIRETLSRGT